MWKVLGRCLVETIPGYLRKNSFSPDQSAWPVFINKKYESRVNKGQTKIIHYRDRIKKNYKQIVLLVIVWMYLI